jgi:phospholipid/cholesterol/gamma-HCH transport system ATP-binding protein
MGAAADQVVIRARDLVVGFGDQVVLDHLSLDLERGEILGVVGASGSGKSVLLRTVIGLVPRRGGSVEFFAMGPDGPQPQDAHAMTRRWGVLFQQGALFSSLTVRQNIQFPLREYLRLSDRLLDEMATAKLELVGLSGRDGDKFPSEISGGMTKRAALARARSRGRVPRRADVGARSDLGRRIRCADPDPAANPRPDGLHGDP